MNSGVMRGQSRQGTRIFFHGPSLSHSCQNQPRWPNGVDRAMSRPCDTASIGRTVRYRSSGMRAASSRTSRLTPPKERMVSSVRAGRGCGSRWPAPAAAACSCRVGTAGRGPCRRRAPCGKSPCSAAATARTAAPGARPEQGGVQGQGADDGGLAALPRQLSSIWRSVDNRNSLPGVGRHAAGLEDTGRIESQGE